MLLFSSPFSFGAGQPLHKIFSLNLIKVVGQVAGEGPIRMPFDVSDVVLSFFFKLMHMPTKRSSKFSI